MGSLKEQAIEIIKTKGLKKLEAPVQLASGAMSQDFVDGKLATAHFDDLEIASRAIVRGTIAFGTIPCGAIVCGVIACGAISRRAIACGAIACGE